jgi:hypothetical protein
MAEIRRIVRLSSSGTPSTVVDLADGTNYQSVRGSFNITPGQRKQTMADSQRRYGGSRATGETHDNGEIGWKMLVAGATADLCLSNFDAAIGALELATMDLYLQWQPDGATTSRYYELRGPAVWQPTYEWAQFLGAKSMYGDIRLPVAPLSRRATSTLSIASTTLPATIALGSIVGTAPALVDLQLNVTSATPPIWALVGWTRRPTAPLASSVAPFGVIQAESGTPTSWVSTVDANYLGGSGLKITTAGAGTASVLIPIDPSTLAPDDFSTDEIAVEVWGRVELASTVVSPRVFLSLQPFAGLTFGAEQFAVEFGSAGKLLTLPNSGTRFRFVKLGTLNMSSDLSSPLKFNLKVGASWAVGSTGQFGLDYIVCVPSRARALSPSSEPNDSTYPKFIAATSATVKLIRYDLSGRVASGGGAWGRDSGLGGSLLQMPPGDVDLVLKLSSLVADDPTLDATTEVISYPSVAGSVRVVPRDYL